MVDVLTWQGIRALAHCEAIEAGMRLRYVQPVAKRATDVCQITSTKAVPFALRRFWPTAKVPTGGIVYARDSWRSPWRDAMVQGGVPHVLVSAFHDPSITREAVETLLSDTSPVRMWFGVQAAATHPRLRAMPIGIDGRKITALRRAAWRSREERDIPLYVNFQLRNDERKACWERFRRWPEGLATTWIQGIEADLENCAAMGRARFVISPPGRGWDCYRTYEAIAMGAVPIVRRQRPQSDVCNGLPVLQVDRWEEVTPDLLDRTWETLTGSMEKLRLSYWAGQIRMAARAAKEQEYGSHVQR